MKRRYRLRKNSDFQRVRRWGQSKSNRLMVLIVLPNKLGYSRFGFAVSRRIGKAVKRNKIKRQMREVARLCKEQIQDGWDLVFIARVPICGVTYQEIDRSIYSLLEKLGLLEISV